MALLIIPGKERFDRRFNRAGGPYGCLQTWNWPITAREISQPYSNIFTKIDKIFILLEVTHWGFITNTIDTTGMIT